MPLKPITKKELVFARYEHQIKIKAEISEEEILKLGAKRLGKVLHEDKYFVPRGKPLDKIHELIRIRREDGENLLFTYKGPIANRKIRNRLVISRPIKEKEIPEITKGLKEIVTVNKKRTIFYLAPVFINLDHVENLGNFIEFDVEREKDVGTIDHIIKKLGLEWKNSTRLSYFELCLMNYNPLNRFFMKISDKFGKFSFGISSAVLTTLGIIVGLNSATESLLAVVCGIFAVAIADSLSDSVGMYSSKKSERGVSSSSALKAATNVFLGKFIFTLTFAIPFLFFPISVAIYICIVWGLLLLAFVGFLISLIQEENTFKTIIKNLVIGIVVIIVSYFVGKLVSKLT